MLQEDKNPWNLTQIPYERPIVGFIDALIEMANQNSSKDSIKWDKDWQTMEFLFKGFEALYPKTASDFYEHMANIRRHSKGVARVKDALIENKMEIPMPLFNMIKIIWKDQKFDKKFVEEFARRFPSLKST